MGRNIVHPSKRKISLTLSVPMFIWEYAKSKGSAHMTEIIKKGMWANEANVNELTLIAIKKDYEEKINKLQSIIESRNG